MDVDISKTSTPNKKKKTELFRMTAHQYEKKINELLETIDILESRLLLLNNQKGYAVTKLKDYEEENDNLKKKINDKTKENEKLHEVKHANEEEINDLKKNNKIFTQRNKEKFENLHKDLEEKAKAIDKLNDELKQKNQKIKSLSLNHKLNQNERDISKKELEEQKKINKKQNKMISDLKKKLDITNIHKKNEGALALEVEHLKEDNIRLLEMMKESSDPAIRNFAFLDNSSSGGIRFIRPNKSKSDNVRNPLSGKDRRARSTQNYRAYKSNRDIEERKDGNNWIPIEAYECAMEFRNKYNLDMTDIEVDQLLSALNKIWQQKLKKEVNSVKAKYQNEIKDLRAKLNMRMPFDEFNIRKQNENLMKNLRSTRDTLRDNIIMKHKLNEAPEGTERVDNLFRTCQNFRKSRKCYENENNRLKGKLKESKSEFSQCNDYHNGALWMAQKTCDEMNKFEKNFNELFGLYEEKVKNSFNNNDANNLNNKIIDNSVNWFFNAVKNSINDSKRKMNEWRSDEQRNLNSLGFSVNHINY
mgnify:CR=1 FL=1